MKDTLKPGVRHTRRVEIDASRTIDFMGDEMRVYATPRMVHDVEHTCRDLLLAHHDEGEDSVGAHVALDHTGATPIGAWVEVTATVAAVDRARVTFDVEVRDAVELVGKGRHVRFAMPVAKLKERVSAKAAQLREAG